jgi:hypothetical protein
MCNASSGIKANSKLEEQGHFDPYWCGQGWILENFCL